MARIEYRPWEPFEVRYCVTVSVPGHGIAVRHAMTQRGARRKAKRLERVVAEHKCWVIETGDTT